MDTASVVDLVQRLAGVHTGDVTGRADLEDALRSVGRVESWLAGTKAAVTTRLAAQVPFPEQTIATCTRGSSRDAAADKARADTLEAAPSLAAALGRADITAGHVDAFTRASRSLDADEQSELFDRLDRGLLDIAAVAGIDEWRRRLSSEIRSIRRDDGTERLERQRRAVRLRTWTDGDGMFCLSGRFDPLTGVRIAARLDHAVEALFARATPDTCPTDPIEKQHHLRGLALASLLDGAGATARPGRPEFVVVVDASQTDGAGAPLVDWGLPVELPVRVLADLMSEAQQHGDVHGIVVRNGVVLHAPGHLDLGRSTRLANRAQRRALRGLYATCAMPGCTVPYARCKLHHVIWWRHGGRTDLDNLLPVCTHHHTRIHDAGWEVSLGPDRTLTIRFPDGTVHTTGPPSRRAA